ncbi:MAG TPA: glycosyltransferase [Methylocystis sp.]|nr:glycosyltransferase [Methylocystis sp.]
MKRKLVIADHNATSAEGHFQTYTSSIASAAHQAGHDVTVLWNKRFPLDSIAAPYRMLLAFTRTEGTAGAQGILPFGQGNFGYELDAAIRPLELGSDDIVFIHTCHYVELVELLEYLAGGLADASMPSFHIVVRYDPELFKYRFARLRTALDTVMRSKLLREKIRFHSDTRLLAEEHQKLFEAPFGVCPIPLDLARLLPALEAAPPQPEPDLLTVTYLGTARTEKGYREILGALQYLRTGYVANRRAQFVLQCSQSSLLSEPGLLDYQRELERYIKEQRLGPSVQLIKEPLKPDAYYSLLARSDIVLIGYSPAAYRYRSSGVLLETMAAGKVVVTTSGSWMASQAPPDSAVLYDHASPAGLGPAIAEALDRHAELRAAALARRNKVIAECSPAAMVDYLVRATRSGASQSVGRNASLLLAVVEGDAIFQRSGAWSRFLDRLRYFDLAGYRVAILFTRADFSMSASDWRRRLSAALSSYEFQRIFVTCAHSEAASRAGAFSFDGDVPAFLRKEPPQCVYLDGAACLPVLQALELGSAAVVCEADSLLMSENEQEHNPEISPSKLAMAPMAGQRFHLIASCRSEADHVRERAPNSIIVECGVPVDLKPPTLCDLAGPVDCLELVASAKPQLNGFRLDAASTLGNADEAVKLSKLRTIDLLFFCSAADSDAAASLRWFLQQVYAPFLAEHRVSLLVGGSIANSELFPQFDTVVWIGPCDCLAPLYAATKVVIASDNGRLGGSLELWDAVARCKPIVATAKAASGLERLQLGIEAHDNPASFAGAVLELLKSKEKRFLLARRTFDAVKSLESAGRDYRQRMNWIFHSALGARALAIHKSLAAVAMGQFQEWTPEIQIINRILRDYLLSQPLESVEETSSLGDQGLVLAKEIADCLLKGGCAPFLQIDAMTPRRVAHAAKAVSANNIVEVIRTVGGASHGLLAEKTTNAVLINRRLPAIVSICALKCDTQGLAEWSRNAGLVRKQTSDYGEPLAWSLPAGARGPELFSLALPSLDEQIEWIVYQDIPIAKETVILGRHAFAGFRFGERLEEGKPVVTLCVETPRATRERLRASTARRSRLFDVFSSKRRSRFHKWAPWAKANPLFDEKFYLERYPDVAEKKMHPFKHYERYGAKEGRNPNGFFDTAWYLSCYPDVQKSKQGPLDHYLELGWLEGYDPSPCFSTTGYFEANPDARDWNMNPLWHYLKYGRSEKREIRPAEPLRAPQTIILPTILSGGGTRWLEIKLSRAEEECAPLSHIEIFCNERKLDLEIERQPRGAVVKSVLPLSEKDRSGTFSLLIAFAEHGGACRALEIENIRVGCRSASCLSG